MGERRSTRSLRRSLQPLNTENYAGRIKPLLDRALPLIEAAEVHRLIANNEVKGSIVLLPWAE